MPGQSPIDLLHDMVSTPSVTGDEDRLSRLLVERMADLGLSARRDGAGNAIGTIGPAEAPLIVLLGHLDTVPGQLPVRIDAGRLYGRGAVDAKGALAAMVHAAARCAGAAVRVAVVGAVDEEGGSRGARHLLDHLDPAAVVIGEPGGATGIGLGYKGLIRFGYRCSRAAAHGSSPSEPATEAALRFWHGTVDSLARSAPADATAFERPVPRLLGLRADESRAELDAACRTPPGFDTVAFTGRLRELAAGDELTVAEAVPAVRVRRDNPVARALGTAIRAHGATPTAKVKLGTSDMNVVAQRWPVAMAAYGPGDSHLCHTVDEHLDLDEYLMSIEVLTTALPRMAAGVRTEARVG